MTFPMRNCRRLTLLVGTLLGGAWIAMLGADEPKAASKKPAAQSLDAAESKAADADKIPDGGPTEMLEYIRELRSKRPHAASNEEFKEKIGRLHRTANRAADKGLAGKPDDETRVALSRLKLESLMMLTRVGGAEELQNLSAFAEKLKDDPQPDLAKLGNTLLMQVRIQKIENGDLAEGKKMLAEVKTALQQSPDDLTTVRTAMQLASALEDSSKDLAIQAYREFGQVLSASSNSQIAGQAKKFAGVVRRLELPGNSIEIKGTLLNGKPFDPATLSGKVVLVDYWATWCGPCIAELPNVLKNYEKYHDRGFEVVGVSLDDDPKKLQQFVEQRELKWPILFENAEGKNGWDNPMAEYYGISGIPTAILVNQQGKVVSLHARGEELTSKLEELLGAADAPKKDAK